MIFDDYLYIAHRIGQKMARRYCSSLSGVVIDVGCGRRPYRRFLPTNASYVGVDSNRDLSPDVVASVTALPFRTGSIDAVMCSEVLEHVPEPSLALGEINRVLRSGSRLYMTVPQSWGLHYEPDDYFRYTRYGIGYLLEQNGFEIRQIEQMGGLFSYFAVRVLDLFVTGVLFRLCDAIRLERGRYRLAAMLVLPFNLVMIPIVSALDRLDATNAYGWAVLAEKVAEPETSVLSY